MTEEQKQELRLIAKCCGYSLRFNKNCIAVSGKYLTYVKTGNEAYENVKKALIVRREKFKAEQGL